MAVKELVDVTAADPTVLPKSVLTAIGDRIRDKKVCVGRANRMNAMSWLCFLEKLSSICVTTG